MFIPTAFRIDDPSKLMDFIEYYGFATLISDRAGVPFATHLPLLLDRESSVLLGHLSRANPHWQSFQSALESLAIFTGPHSYISPSWYLSELSVPTWNYTAVHVYGVPKVCSAERTREIVDRTVLKYESGRPRPWVNELPEDYRNGLLQGVVGFEMPIERLEGKFKLGQNRPVDDRASMLQNLQEGDLRATELAGFIQEQQ